MARSPTGTADALLSGATEADLLLEALGRQAAPWVKAAISDVLARNGVSWATLGAVTNDAIKSAGGHFSEPLDFCLPTDVSRSQLRSDARELLLYLQGGRGLRFWWFRQPVVRRCRYLWRNYRFNGALCCQEAPLKDLLKHLDTLDALDRACREWSPHVQVPPGSLRQRVSVLYHCARVLAEVRKLAGSLERVDRELLAIGLPGLAPRDRDSLQSLIRRVRAAQAVRLECDAHTPIEAMSQALAPFFDNGTAHPAVVCSAAAIAGTDEGAYRAALNVLAGARDAQRRAARCCDLDARLRAALPALAAALEDAEVREGLSPKLATWGEAWQWRIAFQRLQRERHPDDIDGLNRRIMDKEADLRRMTCEMIEIEAWRHCVSRLAGGGNREALGWWLQAVDLAGTGAGAGARHWQQVARQHMPKCREAVSAWIMPLGRVVESTEMRPEAFDVVIVDEASQMGPEGLLLTYLGKQVVIVGDDKQISPEAVGVRNEDVVSLMNLFLDGFPYADFLHPKVSLFEQTIRLGVSTAALREHFRCMPEIIRFSSDLCYRDQPLIPLRQYPPNRLPPIMVRRVVDGYREGTGANVINRFEAAAVVKAIVDCLDDPRYEKKSKDGIEKKTMGVICLQGHSQSKIIEEMLLEVAGPEVFEERQIVCGDPYSFQGDERDVIFLSMVAASQGEGRNGVLSRLAFEQRFNVAASRAKDQVWLFHSVNADELHPHCMRRRLLEYYYNPSLPPRDYDVNRFDSDFERHVAGELLARRYRVIPQYPVAGYRIDLVVEGMESQLAIECDGDRWHNAETYERDMARQRVLEDRGWRFFRIRASEFYANRAAAIDRIIEALQAQGIGPIADVGTDAAMPSWVEEVNGNGCYQSLRSRGAAGNPDGKPTGPAASDEEPLEDDASETAAATEQEKKRGAPEAVLVNATPRTDVAPETGTATAAEPEEVKKVRAVGWRNWRRLSEWVGIAATTREWVATVAETVRSGKPITVAGAADALRIMAFAEARGFRVRRDGARDDDVSQPLLFPT